MDYKYVTIAIYLLLVLSWTAILFLFLGKYLQYKIKDSLLRALIIILVLDALRTLIESIYFSLYHSSAAGFLHPDVYGLLSDLNILAIPKFINLGISVVILGVVIRKWIPGLAGRRKLERIIMRQTHRLKKTINSLNTARKELLASNEKYKYLFDSNPQPMWIFDMETLKYLEVNKAAILHYGYSQEEFLAMTIKDIRPADDVERMINRVREVTPELASAGEWRHRKKNGEIITVEIIYHDISYNGNKARHVIINDITERKLIEIELKKSEEKYRSIATDLNKAQSLTKVGSWRWHIKNNHLEWSDEMYRIFGREKKVSTVDLSDIIQKTIHPDDQQKVLDSNASIFEKGIPVPLEYRLVMPDGTIKTVWAETGEIVKDDKGDAVILTGIVQDISERIKSEQELRESEERFRKIFQSNNAIMLLVDPLSCRITAANESAVAFYGYNRSELLSMKITDIEEQACDIKVEEMQKGSGNIFTHHTANGDKRIVEIHSSLNEINNKKVIFSIIYDITQKFQAEEQLYKLSKALEQSPASVIITDLVGNIQYVNSTFLNITGYSADEVIGQNTRLLKSGRQNPDIYKMLWENITAGRVYKGEFLNRKKNGELFWESMSISPIRNNRNVITSYLAVKEDITQRKLAEERLKESETLLQKAQQIAHLGSWSFNLKRNELTWSEEIFHIFGFQPNEIQPNYETFLSLVHPDDRNHVDDTFKSSIRNGDKYYEVEHRIVQQNTQQVRYCLEKCEHQRDSEGNVVTSVGMVMDITDRILANQKIREKDLQFRKLSASVPDLIFQFTRKPDGSYCVPIASEGIKNIFGCSPEDVLDDFTPIARVIHPDDTERVIKSIEESANNLTYFTCEFRVLIPGRSVQWIYSRSSPERLPDGSITWYGFNTDITERKLAEQRVRESEDKFRTAFFTSPDCFIISQLKDGLFVTVNKGFTTMFGYTEEDVKGKSVFEVDLWADIEQRDKLAQLLVEKGKVEGMEVIFKNKNAKERFGIVSSTLLEINGEKHILTIVHDITHRKQAEEALRLAEIAKKTAVFKQNFLANMSHEIRTPLTGVLGMIDIMEQSELTSVQRDYISTMKASGENLKEIINQVLDYSKIEAGKLTLKPVVFEFVSLLNDAEMLYRNLTKPGINLITQTDPGIPAFILADRSRLSQVLNNLLSNALKFTAEGSVLIKSQLLKGSLKDSGVEIKIEVSDTGIGIPEDLIERLFVPFSQIDDKDTRGFEGTGLGLSICKELVNLMGGNIGVTSEIKKGSTFWFTFPAMVAQQDSIPAMTNRKNLKITRKLKILLVEDKVVNQKVVKLMLNSLGHEVTIASEGNQAFNLYSPGRFDLILMDIQMPVMDGITATKKFKHHFSDLPPIVGLSANAFEGDREKYMEQGMDDYLTKPVRKEDFINLLERLFLK